jgi:hypothetical protein
MKDNHLRYDEITIRRSNLGSIKEEKNVLVRQNNLSLFATLSNLCEILKDEEEISVIPSLQYFNIRGFEGKIKAIYVYKTVFEYLKTLQNKSFLYDYFDKCYEFQYGKNFIKNEEGTFEL